MNTPTANLLRFGDLLAWSQLTEWKLRSILDAGTIGGAPLYPSGRRYYLREIAAHVLFAAPLPSGPFGVEPKPCLLRRADVLAWTGLREKQLRRIEAHGLLADEHSRTRAGGKRHYATATIRQRLFIPLLPQGWPQPEVGSRKLEFGTLPHP